MHSAYSCMHLLAGNVECRHNGIRCYLGGIASPWAEIKTEQCSVLTHCPIASRKVKFSHKDARCSKCDPAYLVKYTTFLVQIVEECQVR